MARDADPPRMTADGHLRLLEREREPMAVDTLRLARSTAGGRAGKRAELADSIAATWRAGWDYWDAVTFALEQNGLRLLERTAVEDDHSKMRDALSLLHSSATHTFHEIGVLLRAGLWAGAAARWRALHEVTVTAAVIAAAGVPTAERYVDHGFVVQTRRLSEYMETHGRGPVGPVELSNRTKRSAELSERHAVPDAGVSFREPYGWAAHLMPVRKKGKRVPPTLLRLEELAGLQDLRLLVGSAHGLVHNDSGGVVTAVVVEPGQRALGPVARFTETVARPALISVQHSVAATHGGFEPELNDFARLIGLFAASTAELAAQGAAAFERPRSELRLLERPSPL